MLSLVRTASLFQLLLFLFVLFCFVAGGGVGGRSLCSTGWKGVAVVVLGRCLYVCSTGSVEWLKGWFVGFGSTKNVERRLVFGDSGTTLNVLQAPLKTKF